MANCLNLELHDANDPSGNGESAVQLVRVDPDTNEFIALGVFVFSNGMNPHRVRLYRRAGDAGSEQWCLQDDAGRMLDASA